MLREAHQSMYDEFLILVYSVLHMVTKISRVHSQELKGLLKN